MSAHLEQSNPRSSNDGHRKKPPAPSLDPYASKLERLELFATNQAYYLIGCNKANTAYRVLKMDRTQIEMPTDAAASNSAAAAATGGGPSPLAAAGNSNTGRLPTAGSGTNNDTAGTTLSTTAGSVGGGGGGGGTEQQQGMPEASHNAKPTLRPLSDFLTEDPHVYDQEEIKEMLDMIHDGNRMARDNRGRSTGQQGSNRNYSGGAGGGGLKPLVRAYGIVGFVRFLEGYYLTLITRRAKVGSIGGHGIYTIKSTESFPLKPAERGSISSSDVDQADPSSVLLSMWNRGKRQIGLGLTGREIAELRYQGLYQVVDLTKNFYFSYTYDLTRSLQENFLAATSKPYPPPPFKDMFAWNYFLTRELEGCLNAMTSYHWVMPLIHGAFIQRKLDDYGRSLNLVLVARRSRHFAGTRYLKRGVSEQGNVANDVESEQILHDESQSTTDGVFSSFIQVRGSIPTFWTQESSVTMPKPPIELNRIDPTYTASQLHFQDLFTRYGSPVVVWDLVKQSEKREREVRVGNEFRNAIQYINTSIDDEHKIRYCALDYSHISKHRNLDVSTSLNEVATFATNQVGFFCSAPKWKILKGGRIKPFDEDDERAAAMLTEKLDVPIFPMEQRGVLRTNCIDCLDRTNVAQFSAGVKAIEQQLVVMGIRSSPKLDSTANIVRVLIDMYVDIGDSIALQYGGSEAHKKVSTERESTIIAGPMGKHKELLTSIRRYYSNAFTDRLKQDAMNLFLGYYVPYLHSTALWDLQDDYYLHNHHVKAGKGTMHSMKKYQRAFGVEEWKASDSDRQHEQPSSRRQDLGGSSSALSRPPRPLGNRSISMDSLRSSIKDNGESHRIASVREKCASQNRQLSFWWKLALSQNLASRSWMSLGNSPPETLLPPRFERLYQPEKVASFDRFFARGWATPVRRTHSAQHSKGSSDDDTSLRDFRRRVSTKDAAVAQSEIKEEILEQVDSVPEDDKNRTTKTLDEFVHSYGLQPHFRPSLKSFVKHHDIKRDEGFHASKREEFANKLDLSYLGSIDQGGESPREEYQRYVSPFGDLDSSPEESYRPGAVDEFKELLHDFSLKSDDVLGIRRLSESAHIGKTIRSGQYRGLSQDESAIEVATLIHEQFNAMQNMRSRGDLSEGISLVDLELKRRGLDASGVRDTVAAGWERCTKAEKQYSEIIHTPAAAYRRSDLTTPASLKLYAEMFDSNTKLSVPDLTFMIGRKPAEAESGTPMKPLDHGETETPFVTKAAKVDVTIIPHSEVVQSKAPPLFEFGRQRPVPPDFEQINEDLYARKDNHFMVFNSAGIDSWNGTEPITKISRMEHDILHVLR